MSDFVNALQSANRSSSVLGAIANPAQINPLAAFAGAAETAGRIYNVEGQRAQKAWGEALQQATDPQTGLVDYDRAKAIAAQTPITAMGMMAGLQGSSELSGAAIVQGAARNKMITDEQSAALTVPDDQLHDAVLAGTRRLVAAGALTPDQAHRALLTMPNDPAQLRAQLERNRIAMLPKEMQQPAIYGAPGSQTGPGGETIGTRQSPQTGVVTQAQPSGSGAPQGLPATALDAPFTYNDPKTGQPVTTTLREFYRSNNLSVPGAATGLPSSLHNPANKAAPPPPPAATPPPAGGPVPTGPVPAEMEQQKQDAANNAAAFQDISNKAVASRDRSSILGNMLADTNQFTTGKLQSTVQSVRNYANRIGLNVNTEGLSAAESFNKLAAQLANAQGAGSDARLNVNEQANPHADLSPAGVNLMIKQLQGNEDYLQARAKLAGSSNQRDIKRFENETGVNLDPRAFQFARMDTAQRQAYVKSLSDKDRATVQKSYNWAHANGVIAGD